MKRIAAIIISVCIAVTGIGTGFPQMLVSDEGIESSAASYPALKKITYTATGNQADDIIGFAKTQTGYKEGSNNNTYFGSWYGCNYNPWCAMFVSWCAAKAGVSKSVLPRLATADRSWGKDQGVYHKSKYWGGSYTPKKGDLIYFSWSVRDWADHIGMVTGTGKSGGTTYVYTIEGNKHDKVIEGSYPLNNKYILGYISPKYTTGNATATTTKAAASYTLKYRDGLDSTSNDEEDKIIPPVKGTFGKDLILSDKKFTRKGYTYASWDVYRENDSGKLVYLCRDKATGKKESWYVKSSIPGDYTQVIVDGGSALNIATAVSGTVYVSPVWKKADYVITYKANGGTGAPAAQTKKSGKSVTLSQTVPTREGYNFLGWAKKADAASPAAEFAPGSTYTTDANLTLYAVWSMDSYDVVTTTGINKRSGPGKNYEIVDTFAKGTTLAITQVKDNWGKLEDGNWIMLDYTVKAGLKTFTLQYSDGLDSTADDSDRIGTMQVDYGTGKSITDKQFSRTGYTYSAWKLYRVCDGSIRYFCKDKATGKKEKWLVQEKISSKYQLVTLKPGEKIKVTEPVTERIYAVPVWEVAKYTITYDANGGTSAPKAQKKKYGKNLTLRKGKPKRSGYTFLGWSGSKTATKAKYQPKGTFKKNKNVTLYAVWKSKYTKVKTTSGLNKRSGPGTDYDVIGYVEEGKTVSIAKTKDGWGKLKGGGWISMSYTKKVASSDSNKSKKETKATTVKKTEKKTESKSAEKNTKTFKVEVTAGGGVNARTGPSKKKDIATSYEKGTTLNIYKVKKGWGKLKSGNWVMLKYTKITGTYKVKVTSSELNQRKGPGTKYDVVNQISPGKYNISKISGEWGKVKETGYWIHLAYTKRIK
ncbi:MAG: InlB B-repeat-containing protein [Firmicutes bacterium]|nr:InlB B-repeat-containing protein [Bacillota bacterium]